MSRSSTVWRFKKLLNFFSRGLYHLIHHSFFHAEGFSSLGNTLLAPKFLKLYPLTPIRYNGLLPSSAAILSCAFLFQPPRPYFLYRLCPSCFLYLFTSIGYKSELSSFSSLLFLLPFSSSSYSSCHHRYAIRHSQLTRG